MIDLAEFTKWMLMYYLPAMIANALPVLVKGSYMVDFGKSFIDGKPIFGKNKTIEGLVVGVIGAYVTGSCLEIIFMNPSLSILSIGAGLSALLGDLAGAFIKRRLNIKPGDPAPLLDQLDFALATTFYYYALGVSEVFTNKAYVILALAVIVILHISTNMIAHALGLKQSKL
ncbi:MAG: CDP-archaeol synthase [Desulfurococcaceae archaeon]